MELVATLGAKSWSKIAQELPGRIGKQCRERYCLKFVINAILHLKYNSLFEVSALFPASGGITISILTLSAKVGTLRRTNASSR